MKYTDLKRQNSQFLAKFAEDQKAAAVPGGLQKQLTSKVQSPNDNNNSMVVGMPRSPSGDLSKSLASNYKREDKEYLEKQRQLWYEQEQAELAMKEVKEEIQHIKEQLHFEVDWEELTWSDKAHLFRYWSIFNFFGNVI